LTKNVGMAISNLTVARSYAVSMMAVRLLLVGYDSTVNPRNTLTG